MKEAGGRDGRVIAVLFGVMFAAVADNQIIAPLLPDIAAAFTVGPDRAGWLVSGYALAAALASFFLGPVSDRWGRKALMALGLAVFAAGTGLCAAAWDFPSLLAARTLTGAAAGTLSMSITAFVGDYFPYRRRGAAMGLVMSGYFAALIIGVPIGAFIASASSWRTVFLVFAGAGALLGWPQWRVLPAVPRSAAPAVPLARSLAGYRRFFGRRDPAMAVVASFFVSASTVGFITYVGTWLRETYALSTGRIGLIFLISGAGALAGSPAAGLIADRVGKRAVVVISSLVMATCLVAIPQVTSSLPAVFIGFVVTGIAGAFRQAPLQALITGLASDEDRGALIALKNTCAEIGIGIGTAFSGVLYSAWGYGAVGLSSAVMTGIAAAMWIRVEEPDA